MQICTRILIFCIENMFFSCRFRKNAVSLRKNCDDFLKSLEMNEKYVTMENNDYWKKMRKILINKYAITLYLFAILFVFVGDNSFIQYVKRRKKMHALEVQIKLTNEDIKSSQSVMQALDNIDSLERFAREEYRMHAPNEDVYIVEP